jgi:hypothetical protein
MTKNTSTEDWIGKTTKTDTEATNTTPGVVKPGQALAVKNDGTLDVIPATSETLGGIIAGAGTTINESGVLSLLDFVEPYIISVTCGANGTISPAGEIKVTSGNDKAISIEPNRGYHISDVLVDGASVGAVSSYTFENVSANHTIAVTFAADAEMSVNILGNLTGNVLGDVAGNVTGSIVRNFAYSTSSADNLIIASGGTSLDWKKSDTKILNGLVKLGNATNAGSITLGGSGTWDEDDDPVYASCNLVCYDIAENVIMAYNHSSPPGSWSYHEVTLPQNTERIVITGSGSHNWSAVYAAPVTTEYKITSTTTGSGITSPAGIYNVFAGSDFTVTMTPFPGYAVKDVLVDGSSVGAVSSYTFESVAANHTIDVTFEKIHIYTMTIADVSNPSSAISYSDEAAGLTQAERIAVLQNLVSVKDCVYKDNAVVYYLMPGNMALKADGTPSVLTGEDGDVMVEYTRIPIKRTQNGNTEEVKISNVDLDGFAAHSHRWGDNQVKHFYSGKFPGIVIGGKLRSIYSETELPTTSLSRKQFAAAAAAHGAEYRYSIDLPATEMFIKDLCMFAYGTRDMQTACGKGNVSNTTRIPVGAGISLTGGLTQGDQSGTTGVCVLGRVNQHGDTWKFIDGMYWLDGNIYHTVKNNDLWDIEQNISTMPATWRSIPAGLPVNWSGSYITAVLGDEYLPWIPKTAGVTGSGSTAYYTDGCWSSAGARCCLAGGAWRDGLACGLFTFNASNAPSAAASTIGARLLCFGLE